MKYIILLITFLTAIPALAADDWFITPTSNSILNFIIGGNIDSALRYQFGDPIDGVCAGISGATLLTYEDFSLEIGHPLNDYVDGDCPNFNEGTLGTYPVKEVDPDNEFALISEHDFTLVEAATSSASTSPVQSVDNPVMDLWLGIVTFFMTAFWTMWIFKKR